jgi:hypothetical protein
VGVLRRHTSGFNHEASLLIGFAGHVGVEDVSTLFCFAAASLRRQLASLGSIRSGKSSRIFLRRPQLVRHEKLKNGMSSATLQLARRLVRKPFTRLPACMSCNNAESQGRDA